MSGSECHGRKKKHKINTFPIHGIHVKPSTMQKYMQPLSELGVTYLSMSDLIAGEATLASIIDADSGIHVKRKTMENYMKSVSVIISIYLSIYIFIYSYVYIYISTYLYIAIICAASIYIYISMNLSMYVSIQLSISIRCARKSRETRAGGVLS